MKTSKRFFDFGLYKEGLRSVQIVGLVFTALLTIVSVFSTVGKLLSAMDTYEENAVQLTSLLLVNPLILLTFCLATPIMTLVAFNFTTKRPASDFYFSVPKTRNTVYWSFSAAVMTWTVFMILLSSAVPLLVFPFFKKYILFNFSSAFLFILAIMICCTLVMGAVNLAIALTGNFVSNVLVSLLIIFLPRILLITVTQNALESIPVIDYGSTVGFLSPYINLVFGMIYSLFSLFFMNDGLGVSTVSFFYTLGLGLLYLILGNIAFNRRKSEAATYAATTPFLRHVYRIALSSAVLLLGTVTFFSYGDGVPGILVITLLFLSLLTYCVYELVTTKSFRSMVRVLPGYFAVIGVNFVLYIAMLAISSAVLSYQPSAEKVDGVYISNYSLTSTSFAREDDAGNELYWSRRTKDVLITDKEVKKIVTDALKQNIKYYNADVEDDYVTLSTYFEDELKTKYLVTFRQGFQKRTRVIYLDEEENKKLSERLARIKEYEKIFTDLPKPNDPDNAVSIYSQYELGASDSEAGTLYSAYLKDLEKLSFSELLDLYNTSSDLNVSIRVKTFYKGRAYQLDLPILSDMGNTVDALIKIQKKDLKKQIKELKKLQKSDNPGISIGFYRFPYGQYSGDQYNYDELLDIILSGDLSATAGNGPFATVLYDVGYEGHASFFTRQLFLPLSDKQVNEVKKTVTKIRRAQSSEAVEY